MSKSYAITVRPRDGISDSTVRSITSWLQKCQYSVSVLEMEDEARHLHAQIWFDKPRERGDICKQLHRICDRTIQDFDNAQLKVLRQGVKKAYSDWYLDYLVDNEAKGENSNILTMDPPSNTLDYYPTEEEQDQLKDVTNSVDPRMTSLEQQYYQYTDSNPTLNSVAKFLSYSMFEARTIKTLHQQRDRVALCTTLHAYINRSNDISLFISKTKRDNAFDELLETLKNPTSLDD